MMRIVLFLLTNLAVIAVASITLSLLGVGSYLEQGNNLNLNNLLAFCLVFGMAGSFVSLLISKWMAKRSMGVHVIEQPQNASEQWLYSTVQELANKAGIGMPEVGIFRSDAPNAFATGWNKNNALVAVSTGLLQRMNKEEVKAVLGHEIGHALAHHGAERMAQQNMQQIVGAGVAMGAGGMDMGAQRAVMGVFGGISQYGYALPFSRKHESEADYIGLVLVARACYDPREAPRLWERMGANAGATPAEFQSTHPSPETRVNDFETWMPEAIQIYNQNCPNKI